MIIASLFPSTIAISPNTTDGCTPGGPSFSGCDLLVLPGRPSSKMELLRLHLDQVRRRRPKKTRRFSVTTLRLVIALYSLRCFTLVIGHEDNDHKVTAPMRRSALVRKRKCLKIFAFLANKYNCFIFCNLLAILTGLGRDGVSMFRYKSPLTSVTFNRANSERATSEFGECAMCSGPGRVVRKRCWFFGSNLQRGKAEEQ